MIVPSAPLLQDARANGYAVGSFNVASIDAMEAVVRAAEAENAPVLAMVWSGVRQWMDFEALSLAMVSLARRAAVPVAVHLDHGDSLEIVATALGLGYSSVMFDGADQPFEENVCLTREAKAMAERHGASLEAEIGEIGGERDEASEIPPLSDVEEAIAFQEAAAPDILAVAIGTQHGQYKAAPRIDTERLRAIAARVSVPLSLHGGSYTPDDQIREAIALGIAKINIASELEAVFLERAATVDLAGARYISDLTGPGHAAIVDRIREKIRLFGSSGRAAAHVNVRSQA